MSASVPMYGLLFRFFGQILTYADRLEESILRGQPVNVTHALQRSASVLNSNVSRVRSFIRIISGILAIISW